MKSFDFVRAFSCFVPGQSPLDFALFRLYFAKFASLTIKYLKFAKFANSWDSKSPLAMYRQLKFPIATEEPKIADLAIYRQKWQHWTDTGVAALDKSGHKE